MKALGDPRLESKRPAVRHARRNARQARRLRRGRYRRGVRLARWGRLANPGHRQAPPITRYMVVIRLSPDAGFTDVHPVRDEKDDKVTLGETTRSTTTSTRSPRSTASTSWSPIRANARGAVEHERLTFHTMFDGQPVADCVRIGDTKATPGPQPPVHDGCAEAPGPVLSQEPHDASVDGVAD